MRFTSRIWCIDGYGARVDFPSCPICHAPVMVRQDLVVVTYDERMALAHRHCHHDMVSS